MGTELWTQENTAKAFDDPQIGDHFSEMGAYNVYVVDREANRVAWCSASGACKLPSNGRFQVGTIDDFKRSFAYGPHMPGKYSVRLYHHNVNVYGWLPIGFMDDCDGELAPFGVLLI